MKLSRQLIVPAFIAICFFAAVTFYVYDQFKLPGQSANTTSKPDPEDEWRKKLTK